MKELKLKYGCNPNQTPAKIYMENGKDLPLRVLGGNPGYINLLDALNSWQLVKELKESLHLPAATSFKHVSPTSAAVGLPLSQTLKQAYLLEDLPGLDDSPLACAYARARGADRLCSFGDWIALSDPCDMITASIIVKEISDGIIAPGYDPKALEILKQKKKGKYAILQIDPDYQPDPVEHKQVFGVVFEQLRNSCRIEDAVLKNVVTEKKEISEEHLRDLIVSLITLKYTQSNSVCYAVDGQAIGVGAGQQSRIHCTRLAGDKADLWHLRQHPKALSLPFLEHLSRPERDNVIDGYIMRKEEDVLAEGVWQKYFIKKPEPFTEEEKREFLKAVSGVSLGSDAFFPFGDSIQRAKQSGVSYVAQPGGSIRDSEVIAECDRLGVVMAFTGIRLFHH